MSEYMITCDLPETLTEDFMNLIPKHRAMVNDFMKKGIFTTYTLALDRSKLWITLLSDDEEAVMEKLAELPLMPYLRIEIYELAFHQAVRVVLPALSLN